MNEDAAKQSRKRTYWILGFVVVSSVLALLPIHSVPWLWAKTIFIALGAIAFGISSVRTSLRIRDEYWRERGKDPKHPER